MASKETPSQERDAVAYHNGKVYTVNDSQPWAEAFIVLSNGTFSLVGSNDAVLAIASRDGLLTYDLGGQFVMPGIHDAHVHLLHAGLSALSNYKPGMDSTMANIAERMKSSTCACEYANTFNNWLVGDLYRIDDFHRSALDKDFPDTPIVIKGGAGHALFANTAALNESGYSIESEPDEPHHQHLRDSSGHLTGEMTELAMTKMILTLPKPPKSHLKRCFQESISNLHRFGVTSCQEASANTRILITLQQLDVASQLNLDVQTHIVHTPSWLGEEPLHTLHDTIHNSSSFSTPHVQTNFVKIMLDGVPLPPYLTHAGLTSADEPDLSKIQVPTSDLGSAITKYDAEGKTVKIHCTGQGSTRLVLNTIADIRSTHPNGPRHEIAHCSGVHPADYALFKKLNVTAEMSPAMFFVHPITAASGGLMNWDFPAMLKADAHVTVGSDWSSREGVGLLVGAAAVLPSIEKYYAEKKGGGELKAKKKAAAALIRMLTLSGAEAVGRGDVTGSVERGKKANFIVVDRDLSEGVFDGANVMGTWFEGNRVWDGRIKK